MKIALFSYDSKPGVDRPLQHKSESYITELIDVYQRAVMLPASAYHRPAAQLLPPRSAPAGSTAEAGDLYAVSAPEDLATNSSISEREVKANAGVADTDGEMFRARAKVKAWMSMATSDERNPLPRGKWADFSRIQVVAVP